MAKPVTISLTATEAQWLYEMMSDVFDAGASTEHDEMMADRIADLLDQATVGE
jgi:hypothetical protein